MSHAALLIGLVLVIARATFLDTLRDPEMPVAGIVGAARAPGATTSLVFDLLMGLPALIVLLRRPTASPRPSMRRICWRRRG
jgi:hypothetical protein